MKKYLASVVVCLAASSWTAEIMAELAPGADPKEIAAAFDLTLIDVTPQAPFAYFGVPQGQDPEEVEAAMELHPSVVWAEEDEDLEMPEHSGAGKATTIGAVGDPNAFYELNAAFLAQINWIPNGSAFAMREVRVAVLDTGLSPRQPFLWESVVASANMVESNLHAFDLPRGVDTNGNGFFDEAAGHGTMVSGIIAQMAPHSKLIVVRVADSDGYTTAWRLIKGIAFAVTSGAEVANVSLGSLESINAMSDFLDWTETRGILIVGAAGNNGLPSAFFPASYSEMLSVSAIDPQNLKAPFSNWDSSVDMAAPGTGIKSFYWDGNMAIWSGTSFSSPMAAATLAIGLEYVRRGILPEILRDLLISTGDDIDPLNDPEYSGKIGQRINVRRFVIAMRVLPH
ncbi:MAG: S8 family peptidase [Fimbriimonadales bacterium]